MRITGTRHSSNAFMGIFSLDFHNGPRRSRSCYCLCLRPGRSYVLKSERGLRGSQTYMQKDFFAEFCEVPPSSMEYLFRRLQEDPFFNNPSNTQALQFSTTRTQATQFAIPSEKLKCGASLFKKSWGISRWLQKSVKLSVGPFWAEGPVWLHRSHPGEVCPANSIFPW